MELCAQMVASRSCGALDRLALPKAARALYTAWLVCSDRMLGNCYAKGPCEVACPCFAREGSTAPFWTRGHRGTGLQSLNCSCRRQPSHRWAAVRLSLRTKGGLRSIPTLYYGVRSARPFLCGATPLATVRHGALLSAREGPWCVIS